MGLWTEEKVYIVEHYFRSYGYGRDGGASLKMVAQQSREARAISSGFETVLSCKEHSDE